MEQNNDLTSISRGQDSVAMSTSNNFLATFHQQSISSAVSKIQRKQSKETTVEPKNEFLKEIDKRSLVTFADDCLTQSEGLIALIQNLQLENGELKAKQTKSDKKGERLESYENMIYELQKKCDEKDAQLADKDHLIEKLQVEGIKNKEQLQSMSNENEKLQAECNSKNAQLDEKMKLIEKLQTDCTLKDKQAKATIDRLKSLGNCLHSNNKLIDVLCKCASECWDQKQYDEELVYWQNVIELEKATYNRRSKLSEFFGNKAGCLNRLKQYQECIDVASLALHYDSHNTMALNNRACAYFALEQYSDARQDLERALQLDPTFERAQNNLKVIQECIDEFSSK